MQPTRQRHRVDSVAMDTWISVQVVADAPPDDVQSAIRHALGWFESVERATSRFEPDSELMCLARASGQPVAVSQLLLESVAFALELARSTDGAFDPTVGGLLERRGFNRLATAAMVLGLRRGLRLLERQRVSGLFVRPDGREVTTTDGFRGGQA
jgi:thiamine biosynthesis lipoprotein ApbE